ncbi:MAG: hypothetical protein KC418_16280 [Anaerolineales bacterium]|nr:hypothetical protein [Anaerolineales bacterium]MCB8953850.1 hypothetical protein [Ardenticatenales bacterium]
MRLEKVRERELAGRKGTTGRTVLQLTWLGICFVIAYFVSNWVFAEGIFTPQMAYAGGLPRAVPEWVIQGGIMLLLVLVMQFFMVLGFLVATPLGRSRSGKATLRSWNPDPNDERP